MSRVSLPGVGGPEVKRFDCCVDPLAHNQQPSGSGVEVIEKLYNTIERPPRLDGRRMAIRFEVRVEGCGVRAMLFSG